MFLVIEIQKHSDSQLIPTLTTWATKEEAENKYHTVLSYAAVSEVPIHSAVVLDETGCILRNKSYNHID